MSLMLNVMVIDVNLNCYMVLLSLLNNAKLQLSGGFGF